MQRLQKGPAGIPYKLREGGLIGINHFGHDELAALNIESRSPQDHHP